MEDKYETDEYIVTIKRYDDGSVSIHYMPKGSKP